MGKKVIPQTELKFASIAGKCAVCGKPVILGGAGDIGATCKNHMGKIGKFYKPMPKQANIEGEYCKLSTLCRLAEKAGKTAGYVVSMASGDGGTKPPAAAVWQVYVLTHGSVVRKFLKLEARLELEKLLAKKPESESK